MPSLIVQITPLGPLIDVFLSVSHPRRTALQAAGQPIPADVRARLLIDTGASHTNLCHSVITQLGLQSRSMVPVRTPSTGQTPVDMPTYDVRIFIPSPGTALLRDPWPVIGADFTTQGIQGLLGRDLLAIGLLTYHGDLGWCTVNF